MFLNSWMVQLLLIPALLQHSQIHMLSMGQCSMHPEILLFIFTTKTQTFNVQHPLVAP